MVLRDAPGLLPKADSALDAIDAVLGDGHPLIVASSLGKDSSTVGNLALVAAARRRARGQAVPRLLIVHSDTRVENPEVHALATGELARIVAFSGEHDLPVEVRTGTPSLYTTWAVSVIGGRALPSFANARRDCSWDWKVEVGRRLQREAFEDLRRTRGPQPVLMTGVRREESAARAANIASRGETGDRLWASPSGELRLSPLIDWTSDDVWEYLGYCSAGVLTAYSDFQQVIRFYRDAGGSSCAVVGDMRIEEVARQSGGCGARSGCWTCVRVASDKSLEQMVRSDSSRYGYMTDLNRLRNFIAITQYDWRRRNFLGRTIDANGYIAVKADVYSPAMLEELLRYTLTVQFKEAFAAERKNIAPRFRIIEYADLVGIDMQWSLYGLHPPFHALKIYFEVRSGQWADIPEVAPSPRTPPPDFGELYVGACWEGDQLTGNAARDRMRSSGIDSPLEGMFSESCGMETTRATDGSLITAWGTSDSFNVDEDGAADFVECMGDEYVGRYHRDDEDRTVGVMTYLSMGIVQPARGSLGRWHRIARRTQWLQRNGLVGQIAPERLLEAIEAQRRNGPASSMADDQPCAPARSQLALFV